MHHYALIKELIHNQYDSAHVVNEGLPLDALPEDSVEALVHAVEHLAQNQLIVLPMPNDEHRHVRVTPENRHIAIHRHYVVLIRVHAP